MSVHDSARRTRVIKLPEKPIKRAPEKLNWPRCAEDDKTIQLGVDVKLKRPDIIKIVHKYFRVADVPMDELLQEVYLAIIHKNCTRSAHDPRKSSFGHYVYMVANNVCINLVHRKRRYDKERNSLDAPQSSDDGRTLLDTSEAPAPEEDEDVFSDHMEDVERIMRQQGMYDLARYVRAARSGASPDIIREALTWGNRKISNKAVRDFRHQIKTLVQMHVTR
jgi:hypothetical protein